LDLGNEFCLDSPQIQAILIRLTGYLLCGKHRPLFITQVIPLAKKAEGNRNKEKLFKTNVFVATVPPQRIPTIKKREIFIITVFTVETTFLIIRFFMSQ